MKINVFNTPPHVAIDTFPFQTNEASITDWLRCLSLENSYTACYKVYAVMILLDKVSLATRLEWFLLRKLMPVVADLAERLENSFIDNGLPLTEEELNDVTILVWVYRRLVTRFSNMYVRFQEDLPNSSSVEKASILYYALSAAAHVQLYTEVIYTPMHEDFWHECYRNYRSAEDAKLINIRISTEDNHFVSIDRVFKLLLIFEICDSHCFRAREMKNLFSFLPDFTEKAVITSLPLLNQKSGVFRFDTRLDLPPVKPDIGDRDDPAFCRYIDVLPVAKKLFHSLKQAEQGGNILQLVNKDLMVKVFGLLSKDRKRKNTRLNSRENANGYIGFNNIVSIIAKSRGKNAENLIPVPKYDPRIAGLWKEPEFDLVPLGDELEYQIREKHRTGMKTDAKLDKIFQASRTSNLTTGRWTQVETERERLRVNVPVGVFEVNDSSVRGYGLLVQPRDEKIRVGEIFGIGQEDDKRIEVGLVRWIRLQHDHSVRLGIELLGLESDTIWLVKKGEKQSQGMLAVLVPGISVLKQPDSVVVSNNHLKQGMNIVIKRDDAEIECSLGHLLHATPAIQHFELIYDKTKKNRMI
ncbi:MAG: hypothetical protein ACU84J_00685 [Gammaproteobacteria bacterium]